MTASSCVLRSTSRFYSASSSILSCALAYFLYSASLICSYICSLVSYSKSLLRNIVFFPTLYFLDKNASYVGIWKNSFLRSDSNPAEFATEESLEDWADYAFDRSSGLKPFVTDYFPEN